MILESQISLPFAIDLRRHFHEHPELSGQEKQTRAKILEVLESLNIPAMTFPHHYGVGAYIQGDRPGPVIALRADMDALPIQEEVNAPYRSQTNGVMHACGHDGHMAILLSAAAWLAQHKHLLAGTIKLVFQPAEEAAPLGGARFFLDDAFLKDVTSIYGLHLWPELPCGQIAIREGAFMAASDRFRLTIHGKSAHAALPHQGVDAISLSASVLQSFSTIISRRMDPMETATISIGTIHGGDRYNVIAGQVVMEGTVRTLSHDVRESIPQQMHELTKGIVQGYHGSYELDYRRGYPALCNEPAATASVLQAARQCLPAKDILSTLPPSLGAEDFASYLQHIPGAFFWLGCSPSNGAVLHSPHFDIDENALAIGARIFCRLALNSLASSAQKEVSA